MRNVIQYLKDPGTERRIVDLIRDNILLYQGMDSAEKIQKCTGLLYNQFVAECVQENQYVSLSDGTMEAVNGIYEALIRALRELGRRECAREDIERLVRRHRKNLIAALERNEYEDSSSQLFIPCAEYGGEFQESVLRLGEGRLMEPIMDIGCGNRHALLDRLREAGYGEAYGLDQYASTDRRIFRGNWFDFGFRESSWGTVIAHMSFSNHLRRMLIADDGSLGQYEAKYREILESLRVGGRFIYTPSVKVLEDRLDGERFELRSFPNAADRDLDTVQVRRIG